MVTLTWEAKVRVKTLGSKSYQILPGAKGTWVEKEIVKMFHIEAGTHRKAEEKAKRYGIPISVRKVQVDQMVYHIEDIKLEPPIQPNAMEMEMIWRRTKRLEDNKKDKKMLDIL